MARTRIAVLGTLLIAGAAQAQITEFNFQGTGGFNLLPTNENGTGAETSMSQAFGAERNMGLTFDASTNVLSFDFGFSNLTGGLADVASGIHFHVIDEGLDTFTSNGPIAFNLNSGSDPNVTLETSLIDFGSTSGIVTGTAQLDAAGVEALFGGRYYLNIHTAGFGGGELRGNLVQVPAPGAAGVLGLAGLAALRRRR